MEISDAKMKERLAQLPKEAYDKLLSYLKDQGRSPYKINNIMTGKTSFAHDYALICNFIGCTIHELLDPNVSLCDRYIGNKKELEATIELMGLTKVA